MLKQRLDGQIINGNGTAPNLRGFLNVVGIQTQAKGADPVPDAIRKAMDLIRLNGRAEPSHVLMHTSDIQDLQLLRTADGLYIWGHPAVAGPQGVWGVPIVRCDSLTAGTALVGDFTNFSFLAVRQGVEVEVTNAHSTFFIEGKQAIRATVRVALAPLRPLALCTITGI
jgi:HK97 family phage major capsid protein